MKTKTSCGLWLLRHSAGERTDEGHTVRFLTNARVGKGRLVLEDEGVLGLSICNKRDKGIAGTPDT